MRDTSSDLPRLRTPRTWYACGRTASTRRLAAAEQREKSGSMAKSGDRPCRTGSSSWVSSQAPDPLRSTRAGKGHRAIGREQALGALADGIRVCIHCRPDIELGVLGYRSGGGPAGRSI
ncbi:DUF6233 domain-containing protein [Streptomyces sp. NBC_01527]|uniref:DUF6233 domain-containing protein n=1 Tax=Streptomyces sp. NBC_01527 TaxID=2903894 RepID=UPI00386FA7A8